MEVSKTTRCKLPSSIGMGISMSTRVPRALLPSELPEVWVSLRCCVAKVPREETRGRRESGSDCLAFEWGRRAPIVRRGTKYLCWEHFRVSVLGHVESARSHLMPQSIQEIEGMRKRLKIGAGPIGFISLSPALAVAVAAGTRPRACLAWDASGTTALWALGHRHL